MPTFSDTESIWQWLVALVDLIAIYLLYWGGMVIGLIPMIQGWYVWLGICYILVFIFYPPMAHMRLAKAAHVATHALLSSIAIFGLYALSFPFGGKCDSHITKACINTAYRPAVLIIIPDIIKIIPQEPVTCLYRF